MKIIRNRVWVFLALCSRFSPGPGICSKPGLRPSSVHSTHITIDAYFADSRRLPSQLSPYGLGWPYAVRTRSAQEV